MSGGQKNSKTMHELKTSEPAESAVRSIGLLACALHDSRKALGRAFGAAQDAGLDKTANEIALTLADVSAAADKTDALVAQANGKVSHRSGPVAT